MRMNMPRLITATLSMAAVVTAVYAASPRDEQIETKAYLSMAFGGAPSALRDRQFFYGLRLDHDRRYNAAALPPLADLGFDRQGLQQARLNGMPIIYRNVALQQTEGEAPAEGGMFSNYSVVDWTLLAVGAVGIGYGISEVVNQKDTPDPATPSTTGGTGGTGGTGTTTGTTGMTVTGVTGTTVTGTSTGTTVTGVTGTTITGYTDGARALDAFVGSDRVRDAEYQKWLDGGTGQMGDLGN